MLLNDVYLHSADIVNSWLSGIQASRILMQLGDIERNASLYKFT
jgi:hypothetical protein